MPQRPAWPSAGRRALSGAGDRRRTVRGGDVERAPHPDPGGAASAHSGSPRSRRAAAFRRSLVRRNGRRARRAVENREVAAALGAPAPWRTAAWLESVMRLTSEDDALLQGLLDGTLGPAERDAAERLVAPNGRAGPRAAGLSGR